MNISDKVSHFQSNVKTFVDQITVIQKSGGVGLSGFILTCCLIDTVASYCIKETYNNKRYKKYISEYMVRVNSDYSNQTTGFDGSTIKVTDRVYESIRCALVHSFTVGKGVLLCELEDKSLHNKFDLQKNYILDLDSFISDSVKSIDLLLEDLREPTNKKLRKYFESRYDKYPPFKVYETLGMTEGTDPQRIMEFSGITEDPTSSYYSEKNYRS